MYPRLTYDVDDLEAFLQSRVLHVDLDVHVHGLRRDGRRRAAPPGVGPGALPQGGAEGGGLAGLLLGGGGSRPRGGRGVRGAHGGDGRLYRAALRLFSRALCLFFTESTLPG